ncbi:MAG: 50S ribosomal protein L28 [Rickettsia sp.]|nr:50S ribosomal protein L28 [Rickettsia sp.]
MSRKCQLSGVSNMSGNNVSHSNRKTKRKFKVNVKHVSFWSNIERKHYNLKISTKTLRTIDKLGGFDNYILSLSSFKATDFAKNLKKRFIKRNVSQINSTSSVI